MSSKTAKEILIGAAAAIRERGHCKGNYEDENGCLCTYGAINVATWGKAQPFGEKLNQERSRAVNAVRDVAGNTFLDEWNDDAERTADEVIITLERAAESLT